MFNLHNILESNHTFDDHELPLKFKFRLLNTIMMVIITTATTFGILHYAGLVPIGNFHANINFFFAATNLILIIWLRHNKSAYNTVMTLMLISGLITFTSSLITIPNDEFRMIWFFLMVFLAFFAGSIYHGYFTAALSIIIILVSNHYFDLNLSPLAISTAIIALLLLTLSIKVYTQKMIDLENALTTLNDSLNAKVKETVDEVRQKDKMMLQQARLAQMGEMIAMIAHQWRQPLSSISAISTKLQLSLALGEEIDKGTLSKELQNIDKRVLLLSDTIDDFRNFYNANNQKNSFDLSKTITQTLEVLKPAIDQAEINLSLQNSLKTHVNSLEGEVLQVVMNLIKNAIDVLKEHEGERNIWIRSYQNRSHAFVSVEDNAGGIDQAVIERIFEPYFSTKKEKNGMGLGLYMSQLIIQKHCNGTINVKNSKRGALFVISLPL